MFNYLDRIEISAKSTQQEEVEDKTLKSFKLKFESLAFPRRKLHYLRSSAGKFISSPDSTPFFGNQPTSI